MIDCTLKFDFFRRHQFPNPVLVTIINPAKVQNRDYFRHVYLKNQSLENETDLISFVKIREISLPSNHPVFSDI
jgi:hypothetical protein